MSSYVFIDGRVPDHETLLAALAPDVEVILLDTTQDGIAQIAAALEGVTDLDAIHIISHGSEGTLYLGGTVLTNWNLDQYKTELADIGAALTQDGDILLYGCDVASGATGQSFIENLALYTGADVAASTDLTGAAALGGNWVLEVSSGAIEAQAVAPAGFDGLLAPAIDLANVATGTGGFVIYGQDAGDYSGRSVASAGDINGDGFDDLIIGARGGDAAGNAKYDAGDSYVVFGKAGGWAASIDLTTIAAGTGGFVIYGQDVDDQSGFSVASAGDVNGDGFDDLIIGARRADAAGNLNSSAGDSYVVFGKVSGFGASIDLTTIAAGTGGFVIYGQDVNDQSGRSVASAGDVNGDGFDDLIIGTRGGDSYVVFGKAGGFAASIDLTAVAAGTGGFVIYGAAASDLSGLSVASAGDINGDGFDDLIIGASYGGGAGNAKPFAGDSYVVFGKASGFGASIDLANVAAGTGGFVIYGQDLNDRSGFSVASAGDINGDGFDDLIIGAYRAYAAGNVQPLAGDSYVVFGKASGFGASIDLTTIAAGTGGFVIYGQDRVDRSGWSVASAGDINGDGFDDLIIGAYGGDAAGNAKSYAGESYVVFGKASGFGASIDLTTIAAGTGGFVIYGQDAGDGSGTSVAPAGDINGDGFDDLIIGAPWGDAAGNAKSYAGDSYVIFGANFSGVVTHQGTSNADTLTGTSGADIMIGGQGNDVITSAGGADVMRGGAGDDVLRVADFSFQDIDGGSGADALALSGAGMTLDLRLIANNKLTGIEIIDLSGSGNNTLILTALEVLNISDSANSLRVDGNAGDVFMLPAGDSGWIKGATLSGYTTYSQGQATLQVASALTLAAAPVDLTTVAAGTGGFVIYGQDAGDRSGHSVASAGDINGDGFDDLIIGAFLGHAAGNAKPGAGDSYVVFGKASGWAASIDLTTIAAGTGGFVVYGQDANDYSGISVASAGDVNGDGFDDLIIGADGGDAAGNVKNAAGDSYVVFGKASGFGASIDLATVAAGTGGFVIYGQDARDGSGFSVASAGDINGDGFDDLIIGAAGGDAAGNAKIDAGDSYVVFGKAGGWAASIDLTAIAAGTGGFVIYGQDAGDRSGWSVASAGDINGDGFDDLIIGASYGSAAGDSYVVFGKASGWAASIDLTTIAAGTGGFVIYGQYAGDQFGRSVASAGDVNGDGFDDLIIGARFGDAAGNAKIDAGDSYVVFGKASGFGASIDLASVAAGTGGFVIYGQDANDMSGYSVASAGDVNGDGFDDLIVGVYRGSAAGNARSGAGDSYVVFGKAGGWAASIDLAAIAAGTGGFVIYGQDAYDKSGISVASAGDINGDGFDDLLIGAYGGDAAGNLKGFAGDSYVVFGADFSAVVTHQGGEGADSVTGGANADIMIGGLGNDTLNGAGGADVMRGGAGDDNFVGGGGADRMNGGNGLDTADYTNSSLAVILNLSTNQNSGGDAEGDKLSDIENLIGSAFGDTITGDTEANVLSGGGGNDTLSGAASNDTLTGGAGNDTFVLTASGGTDRITDFNTGDAIHINGVTFLSLPAAGDGSTVGQNQAQFVSSGGVTTLFFGLDGTPGADLNLQLTGTYSATEFRLLAGDILFNNAPAVANPIADQVTAEDALFSFQIPVGAFSDVDPGDSLTYTVTKVVNNTDTALPGWLTWNAGTRTLSGTPLNADVGNFDVKVSVTDGGIASVSDLFRITVTNTNDPPVFASTPPAMSYTDTGADDSFSTAIYSASATDDDGDTVTWRIDSGGSAALTRAGTYGTLTVSGNIYSYAPNDAAIEALKSNASDTFTLRVSDGIAVTTQTLTVTLTGANDSTTFGGTISGNVNEDGTTSTGGTLTVSDRDAGDAAITAQSNTAGTYGNFSIGANGVWSYSLNNSATNVQALKAGQNVSDPFTVVTAGGSTQNITLSIAGANDAPVITTTPSISYTDTAADDFFGGALYFASASDPEFDTLIWAIQSGGNLVTGLAGTYGTLTSTGSVYTYTPNDAAIEALKANASDPFTVWVSDGTAVTTQTLTVSITGVNDPTSFGGVTSGNVSEDDTTTIGGTLTVSDRDAGDAAITTQSNTAGTYGSFSIAANGVWSYTLANAAANVQALKAGQNVNDLFAVVTTGGGTQSITVAIAGANDAPTVANPISAQSTKINYALSYQIPANTFNDVEGDTLNYSAKLSDNSDLPAWLNFDPGTRTFSGTPVSANLGTLSIKVTATDPGSAAATHTFTLNVNSFTTGTAGADTLDGGAGGQTMTGLQGDDTYIVDSTNDVVVEQNDAAEGSDVVQSSVTYTLPGSVELMLLTGSNNIDGTGNNLNNQITGNSGNNRLDGGTGIDTLNGGLGNDTYVVDNVNDQVNESPGAGSDTIEASSAVDNTTFLLSADVETLILKGNTNINAQGNGDANTLTGNPGNNNLMGGAGNDTLNGGAGNDTLDGGPGADSMTGGTGDDLYYVDDPGDQVIELANEGTDTVQSSITWTLTGSQGANVENLILAGSTNINGTGNTDANIITGNSGNNSLDAGGGTAGDSLDGGAGNDILTGAGGNDTLKGGTGVDVMAGGAGNDLYYVDTAADSVTDSGGNADQVVIGINFTAEPQVFQLYAGIERVTVFDVNAFVLVTGNDLDNIFVGANGNDSLDGALGNDSLTGGLGNDTLNGGSGVDTMEGGGGRDTYYVDNLNDRVVEISNPAGPITLIALFEDLIDTINASISYSLSNVNITGDVENLTLTGTATTGSGNELPNTITGEEVDNTLSGLDNNDTLIGGLGNDTLDGGAGTDVAVYAGNLADYQISTVNGTTTVTDLNTADGDEGSDTLTNIETLRFANLDTTVGNSDPLHGGAGDDHLTGGAGADIMTGGAGNDTLDGGPGADQLFGGIGNDTYYVDGQADIVFENAGEGTDTVISTTSFYLYDNIENLTLAAGTGNTFGSANAQNNILTGNEGNNLLLGWDGNDTIYGGAGNDVIYGVNNDDVLNGDAGIDVLIAGEGNDTLDGGADPDEMYGENGDDRLYGGTGFVTDILVAGAGNDTLDGSASIASGQPRNAGDFDFLYGGTGDDTYFVDTPSDLTFEFNGNTEGIDTVIADISGAGFYLYDSVENLTLVGNTVYGVGNGQDNQITGNAIGTYLLGGAGNDTINGKAGNDVLFGEAGADTFVFERGTGGDVIGDFQVGIDKIKLVGIGYNSFADVSPHMIAGATAAIDLGLGDFIVINGVNANSLTAGDFLFA